MFPRERHTPRAHPGSDPLLLISGGIQAVQGGPGGGCVVYSGNRGVQGYPLGRGSGGSRHGFKGPQGSPRGGSGSPGGVPRGCPGGLREVQGVQRGPESVPSEFRGFRGGSGGRRQGVRGAQGVFRGFRGDVRRSGGGFRRGPGAPEVG